MQPVIESMINEDDPNHRRLRELVRRGFRPQAVTELTTRIEAYSLSLLDELEGQTTFELQSQYALKLPMRMISDMLGISSNDAGELQQTLGVLTKGFSGWRMLRTLVWDMPTTVRFVQSLVAKKRQHPGDDILTGLIEADDNGDKLTENELVAMVLLLIIGGYETTVHLITNGILTLLQHPQQLELLRSDMSLVDSAVEEILRHRGPLQSTKPGFASEDIELHGVIIPKGKPVMPLLGAANHDPRAFADPLRFDIGRNANRHLGFGHGVHFCLGAHLARAEATIGIRHLIERFPNLRLAVEESTLQLQTIPGWHRYQGLPLSS